MSGWMRAGEGSWNYRVTDNHNFIIPGEPSTARLLTALTVAIGNDAITCGGFVLRFCG